MFADSWPFFDAKDHELLHVVNSFIEHGIQRTPEQANHSFFPALHPHGIKELALTQEIRVAYAVINLLDSLEIGQAKDRITALHVLRDEVLYTESTTFRHNTGRVLIQIMKELIRAHGNEELQLRLAHDFRKAATGKRRIIRKFLERFYLLEMPEEWNQLSFDHHIHDANTKGRKSPTHLIMDAWIKGIRHINVIYYNYIEAQAVEELLQAADIMGIHTHIGVEFQARFRDRFVQFIWEPQGFNTYHEMLNFLEEKPTKHLMRMGREASLYHHHYVLHLLERYNTQLRHEIGEELTLKLEPIAQQEILSIVGIGQTSRTHLAELIYKRIQEAFTKYLEEIHPQLEGAPAEERARVETLMNYLNAMTPESILQEWLTSEKNPEIPIPQSDDKAIDLPEIMRLLPATLIDWLTSIRTPCHITLNLRDLSLEDVLELIYECEGMITHLELFNLKNYLAGHMNAIPQISELQTALNEGNAITLKRMLSNCIQQYENNSSPDSLNRLQAFKTILHDIPTLQNFYAHQPLRNRIGSDSTSRSSRLHGMGFVFSETLPDRAQKAITSQRYHSLTVPLQMEVYSLTSYRKKRYGTPNGKLAQWIRKIPGLQHFGLSPQQNWRFDARTTKYDRQGNIATLGGYVKDTPLAFNVAATFKDIPPRGITYLNTTVKNIIKVLIGFSLAAMTFAYTQSWWFYAWFGAVIWFAITGFRNILQATLGGGGLKGSPLLKWNDYLSWSRLSDSLLYTGLSVPLLELGVRWFLLEHTLQMNSLTDPILSFTIISLINGVYIASHNLYRGLPREAVIGNIFRSFLAIPLSLSYNYLALQMFLLFGWNTPADLLVLQQGAAVLSKLASDSVAAIIEGMADRNDFLRMRHWDYSAKLAQLFSYYSQLEISLPDTSAVTFLNRTDTPHNSKKYSSETHKLEQLLIICSLDLLYFWMYQPRARDTFKRLLVQMSQEERTILISSQSILLQTQKISLLFINGLFGKYFAKPLAFYLEKYESYLADMKKLAGTNSHRR